MEQAFAAFSKFWLGLVLVGLLVELIVWSADSKSSSTVQLSGLIGTIRFAPMDFNLSIASVRSSGLAAMMTFRDSTVSRLARSMFVASGRFAGPTE